MIDRKNFFTLHVLSRTGVSNSWASGGHIVHISNRAEGRVKFFDLDITTSSGKDLCNVARSEIYLQKKMVITSPASPHHRSYESKSSSVVARSGVISG